MKSIALRKSGGSLILAVPAFFTETHHLAAGDRVEVAMEGQDMIVRPARRRLPRYTMEQLLAEHEEDIPRLPAWEAMPPVGQEIEGF
jgi:antitoxin component of MazEF toxin-antitoxin module